MKTKLKGKKIVWGSNAPDGEVVESVFYNGHEKLSVTLFDKSHIGKPLAEFDKLKPMMLHELSRGREVEVERDNPKSKLHGKWMIDSVHGADVTLIRKTQ